MKFSKLSTTTLLLGIVGLAQSVRITYYGETSSSRPSDSRHPSCGPDSHYDTDYFIALSGKHYDDTIKEKGNSYSASVCDQCVKVVYKNKYAIGRIVDSCPGCEGYNDIDVSPKLFAKLEELSRGVLRDVEWKLIDSCSDLGKSGECDGNCDFSDSSSSAKTTTTTAATATTTKTSTSSVVGATPNTNTLNNNSTTTGINNQEPLAQNTTTTPSLDKIEKGNVTVGKTNTIPITTDEEDEDDKKGNNSVTYVLPITGALVLTGAAGIGLLYAKRNPNNYETLKAKFPEAFTNLKRSFTRGSSNLRRNLTRSGNALKRSLSGKKTEADARTKKDYRESLNAHYPITGIVAASTTDATSAAASSSNEIEHPEPTYKILDQFDFEKETKLDIDLDFKN